MSDAYSPPSINPADEGSLAGALSSIMRKAAMNSDDCLPATIVAYDRDTNLATVQPQIMMLTTGGEKVRRAGVASVPVLQLGGGGFVLSFPVKPGDPGWIKATDRDISLYLQSANEEIPNTDRLHSFQDGWFIPDTFMRGVTIDPEDADRLVLQSLDGATRLAMGPDIFVAVASSKVKVEAPTVEVVADTMTLTGDLVVDGEVTASGIALSTHTHGGVQSGASNTLAPNP